MTYWAPIPYECRRTSCDAFDIIFNKIKTHRLFRLMNKIKMHRLFRLMKIPLTSNKDPQNIANRLKDAGKLLKVHLMFKLKVELEFCSVCFSTGNCSQKFGNTKPLICLNSHLLTTL